MKFLFLLLFCFNVHAVAPIGLNEVTPYGLVYWYTCNEGKTTNILDYSGYNFTAYTTNASNLRTNGIVGGAVYTAQTNYFTSTASPTNLFKTNFTICAWVQFDIAGSYPMMVTASYGAPSFAPFEFRLASTTGRPELLINSGGLDLVYANSIVGQGWTFVTARYDGVTATIWTNAVPVSSSAYSTALTFTNGHMLAIANRGQPQQVGLAAGAWGNNYYPATGLIDDVRIYNRALETNEIIRIYNKRAGSQH